MIIVQVAAGVAELDKFPAQHPVIFGTMHLDEENGTLLTEQALGSLEDSYFRTFYVAFEEVRGTVRQGVLVKRDSFDGRSRWQQPNPRTKRGRGRDRERCYCQREQRKQWWARTRPPFPRSRHARTCYRRDSLEASGNFRIGLKRNYPASGTYKPRCHKRKEANVGPKIVEGHPGTYVFLNGVLNCGLANSLVNVLPSAGIHANPQSLSWTLLNLDPDHSLERNELAAGPTQKLTEYREATKARE